MGYSRASLHRHYFTDISSLTMQLLLIRHASNDWVGKRLAGRSPGVHLNSDGHREAEELATRLHGYPIDAVYSSPLERALETARYLAEPRGLEPRLLEAVGEVSYGNWTGKTLEELRDEPLWARAMYNPSGVRFPGGESICDVQSRVIATLEGLSAEHCDGVIAVVAHGDVVKIAVAHYLGLHLDLFQRIVISTASLTVLRFTPHGPRLLLLNDTGSIPPPPDPKDTNDSDERAHDGGA